MLIGLQMFLITLNYVNCTCKTSFDECLHQNKSLGFFMYQLMSRLLTINRKKVLALPEGELKFAV